MTDATTRTETDSLGSMEIPSDAYWGIHTARALENFPISSGRSRSTATSSARSRWSSRPRPRANRDIGALDPDQAELIDRASQLVIDGEFHDQFVVGVIQGGAGHVDEHERERGHHQYRARDRWPREGRLPVPVAHR